MTLSPTAAEPDVNEDVDGDFGFELVAADPRELQIRSNVRVDPKVEQDAEFLDSVRRRGVRTAISAYRDADGELVVLRGQRRTLAAVMTGRRKVPVVVEAEPSPEDLLADQVMENDQRAALMPAEHVAAYEQMEALGFSAQQIASRLATKPEKVDAGLRVAKNAKARAALGSIEQLDVLRAAVFEEFADDPNALHLLELCAKRGGWDHQVQRLRDDRECQRMRAAAEDELEASGVKVLRGQSRIGTYGHDGPMRRLDSIRAKAGSTAKMQARNHAKCKGHAAYVEMLWGARDEQNKPTYAPETVFVCKDPKKYGHELFDSFSASMGKTKLADMPPEEAAAKRAENRQVKANNAAMRSATTLRLQFVASLLERKKMPVGAGKMMAAVVFRDRDKVRFSFERSSRMAHRIFGMKVPEWTATEEFMALGDDVSDLRGQLLALVVLLAGYEDNMGDDCWRVKDGGRHRYLKFLQSCGYELSPVEQIAAGLREIVNVDELQEAGA